MSKALAVAMLAGAASTSLGQDVLFDTGPSCTVFFNAAASNLGWSSGTVGAGSQPQRWAAQPFTLASASHVTTITVNGFDGVLGTIGNVAFEEWKLIIWSRTGLAAPVAANQVATATIPTSLVNTGAVDPRVPVGFSPNMYYALPVDMNLPAGDYYLTVYANNTSGADANFAWLANTQLDTLLVPVNTPIVTSDAAGTFMWRSVTFPTPGFERYTTAAVAINPAPGYGPGSTGHPTTAQDPQYLYTAAFQIIGTTGGAPCYPNCDNSTTPPTLNVADFTCFLQSFAAGNSTANCDNSTTPPTLNVADFTCFLQSFAAGCP